jgi:hypothetical protein
VLHELVVAHGSTSDGFFIGAFFILAKNGSYGLIHHVSFIEQE